MFTRFFRFRSDLPCISSVLWRLANSGGAGFHSNDFQLQALLHYCNEIPKYVALKVRALVKKLRPTKMLPSIVPAPWDDMAACPSTKFRYSNPSQQYRATAHFFLGPITAWALHLNRATVFVANLPPKWRGTPPQGTSHLQKLSNTHYHHYRQLRMNKCWYSFLRTY
jgi:hypothetical protein